MARPRTPSAVLEAKGAFLKDPKRGEARKNEPKPSGQIGSPPRYFDKAHRDIWKEFIREAPRGVLTSADRKLLELAVRLTCKMRFQPCRTTKWLRFMGEALETLGMAARDVSDMKEAMRTAIGCTSQELSLLSTCLTRMGLTPADRSRVQVEPEEEQDEFADLAAVFRARPN